jgi:hypothetical protein
MSNRSCLALVLLLFPVSLAMSQGENPRRNPFRERLGHLADSVITMQHAYADTLIAHGNQATGKGLLLLGRCVDSLMKAAGDSIDAEGRIALRTTELGMRTTLGTIGFPARSSIHAILHSFDRDMSALQGRKSVCAGCTTPADFSAALELFASESDTLAGIYGDSMATVVEAWEDAIDDSVVAFSDSVLDQISTLTSEYAERRESESVSHLVVGGTFQTHSSYRGRDDGIVESTFGGTLTYHHRTGLFIGGGIGWTSRPTPGPDDGSLDAGYEFDLSSVLDGSLTYTHYWYSDSSTRPQAVTNQSVEGMFTLDLDAVSFLGTLSYDFGGGTGGAEFTATLDVSKDIMVPGKTLGGTLMFSPTLSATWGDQDERLLQRRLEKLKKKVVVVRSAKPALVFGIMAYEVSLPVRLHVGMFSFEPQFEYIIPAGVLNSGRTLLNKDPSTTDPYVSFSLGVEVTVQ